MLWEAGIRCQGCCNCGVSVAGWGWFEGSFMVWLLMGEWVLMLRQLGLDELVRTNLWSSTPPNFCELQNMPVSYSLLPCLKMQVISTLDHQFQVLPKKLKSPQGSLVVKNSLLCQSCECGLSSPGVPWASLSMCWGCSTPVLVHIQALPVPPFGFQSWFFSNSSYLFFFHPPSINTLMFLVSELLSFN